MREREREGVNRFSIDREQSDNRLQERLSWCIVYFGCGMLMT